MLAASCSGSTSGCFGSPRHASAESRRLPLIAAAASKSPPPVGAREADFISGAAEIRRGSFSFQAAASRGRKAALFWAECCLNASPGTKHASQRVPVLFVAATRVSSGPRGHGEERGRPSAARLLALVFVSVPSPPLPGCHVHLGSCRAQSGTMAACLITSASTSRMWLQVSDPASFLQPYGAGGGGTRLCRVHGRDGRLAPTSAAPPRRARLVSCTATLW